MWQVTDNQEVGLEAAILQRKRNSSLVKTGRAENVTGLKSGTEASGPVDLDLRGGRGASQGRRSPTARAGGAPGSADAEMSSDKGGENPPRRKPKVSWVKSIFPGLAGS